MGLWNRWIFCFSATRLAVIFLAIHGLSLVARADEDSEDLFWVVRREKTPENILPAFVAGKEAARSLLDENCNAAAANEEGPETESSSSTCKASPDAAPPVPHREEYDDGVFVIHNVLTPEESQRFIQLSETMGYTEENRLLRSNQKCLWIMDEVVSQTLFDRCKHLLPTLRGRGGQQHAPIAINNRWRIYKYNPTERFAMHQDYARPGSGLDDSSRYVNDIYDGKAVSWLTFLIYLNDDFEGGTTMFARHRHNEHEPLTESDTFHVKPKQGSAVVFFHGYHPRSMRHEGARLLNGTKYAARTEVLYYLLPRDYEYDEEE